MGIKNYIDGKGFWSERTEGSSVVIIASGSMSYMSPMLSAGGSGDITLTNGNTTSDSFIMVDASTGAIDITLPPIASDGYRLTFKKIDGTNNIITIYGATTAQKIDEEVSIAITVPMSSLRLVTYNSKWWIF